MPSKGRKDSNPEVAEFRRQLSTWKGKPKTPSGSRARGGGAPEPVPPVPGAANPGTGGPIPGAKSPVVSTINVLRQFGGVASSDDQPTILTSRSRNVVRRLRKAYDERPAEFFDAKDNTDIVDEIRETDRDLVDARQRRDALRKKLLLLRERQHSRDMGLAHVLTNQIETHGDPLGEMSELRGYIVSQLSATNAYEEARDALQTETEELQMLEDGLKPSGFATLKEALADATSALDKLKARVTRASRLKPDAVSGALQRLSAAEADLKGQVSSLRQNVDEAKAQIAAVDASQREKARRHHAKLRREAIRREITLRRTNQKLQARIERGHRDRTKVKAFLDLVTEKGELLRQREAQWAKSTGILRRVDWDRNAASRELLAKRALTAQAQRELDAARWLSGAGAKTEPTRDEKRYRARLKKDDERLRKELDSLRRRRALLKLAMGVRSAYAEGSIVDKNGSPGKSRSRRGSPKSSPKGSSKSGKSSPKAKSGKSSPKAKSGKPSPKNKQVDKKEETGPKSEDAAKEDKGTSEADVVAKEGKTSPETAVIATEGKVNPEIDATATEGKAAPEADVVATEGKTSPKEMAILKKENAKPDTVKSEAKKKQSDETKQHEETKAEAVDTKAEAKGSPTAEKKGAPASTEKGAPSAPTEKAQDDSSGDVKESATESKAATAAAKTETTA